MGEGPKLYVNKPKKAKMKQVKGIDVQSSSKPSSSTTTTTKLPSSSAISSYYSTASTINGGGGSGSGGVSKPPEIPKESFAKRYKYLWPMLLTVNLGIGGFNPKLLPIFDSYPIEENTTNQISVAKRNVYPCCNPQHFAAMLVHNTLAVEYVCIITFGCCSQLASTMVATMGIACWKLETNSVHSNPLTAITYWKRPEQKGMANFVFDPGGFQCSKNRVDSSSRRGV